MQWGASLLTALRAAFGGLGRERRTAFGWMGEGCTETVHQSSFPMTRPVRLRLLLQAKRWGERDSSIRASGIPGLREREALGGLCGRGGACPVQGRWPPWPALRPTPILCLSAAAPGTVETLVVVWQAVYSFPSLIHWALRVKKKEQQIQTPA